MSSEDFKTKTRRARDGYEKTTWRCRKCGAKVISVSVGNGPGWRYGMALFVRPSLDAHKCGKAA